MVREERAASGVEDAGWSVPERAVAAALVLSAIVWLVGVAGTEVYPAANLPSFGGIPAGDAEPVTWEVSAVDEEGRSHVVSHAALFEDVPDSQWPHVFDSLLQSSERADVAAWFASQVDASLPITCTERISLEQGGADPQRRTFDGSCD